jgi:hypothetical protein
MEDGTPLLLIGVGSRAVDPSKVHRRLPDVLFGIPTNLERQSEAIVRDELTTHVAPRPVIPIELDPDLRVLRAALLLEIDEGVQPPGSDDGIDLCLLGLVSVHEAVVENRLLRATAAPQLSLEGQHGMLGV